MAGRDERLSMLSDIVIDPQEIRPEQEGGAAVMAHDASRAGSAPVRTGRQTGEEGFYLALLEARTPVHIRCRDGYEIPHAVPAHAGQVPRFVARKPVTAALGWVRAIEPDGHGAAP